jgi:uncharacterized cysteine cluster protein YcgN (CxxCxxCC family)
MPEDPIERDAVRRDFWAHVPMEKMTKSEWEALCDGCGKCCLNKLEDEDTGEVVLTSVACRLLDGTTCHCSQYPIRQNFVPECIQLTPETLHKHLYWIPQTCAYRLVHEGRPLYPWHPLISGTPQSVHDAGVSALGISTPEFEVPEEDWENHIIEEPT